MNAPKGKKWHHRTTNRKIRRVLNNCVDGLIGKVSGKRMNRAHWGVGLSKKSIVGNPNNNLEPKFIECMSCGESHIKLDIS